MTAEDSVAPIAEDQPCGEDLDFEEDPAYLQFTSGTEAILPDSYTVDDEEGTGKRVPFYTTQRFQHLDLGALVASASRLLERTQDIRLLTIVAKLQILNRELGKFQATVATIATLLNNFWNDVHPRDSSGRALALERLTEPLVLAALNHAVLFRSRRFGLVTWVTYQAAAKGTEDNPASTENVDRILRDEVKSDPSSVIASQGVLDDLLVSLRSIVSLCTELLPSGPPNLQKLLDGVGAMLAMLNRVHPSTAAVDGSGQDTTDPISSSTSNAVPAASSPSVLPLLANSEAAEAALAEAARFFSSVEPSSPTLLLLNQAQALVGRSFFEALQVLLPNQIDKAKLSFGSAPVFTLPLRQIAEATSGAPAVNADEPAEGKTNTRMFTTVTSRADALSLLEQVGAYYRFVEPSSPIPLLVDRARTLAGRDFTALLQAMLPEKSDEY